MEALLVRSKATVLSFQSADEQQLPALLRAVRAAMPKEPRAKRALTKKRSSLQSIDLNSVSFHVRAHARTHAPRSAESTTSVSYNSQKCFVCAYDIISLVIFAMQEEFELAQRKFLRHLALLSDKDTMPYPRLFLLDFAKATKDIPAKQGTCC